MEITLLHFPGLCSRVTMNALEEAGIEYEDRLVNTRSGEQKSSAHLALNPKAKIPVLVVGQHVLTENAAILLYLHRQFPDAHLLPERSSQEEDLTGLIDLVWCSSTLHPLVRQIRRPDKLTTGDEEPVRQDGIGKFAHECDMIARRVEQGWWYGDNWSIIDTYLYWAYSTAELGGFPLDDFQILREHARRVRSRESFDRVLLREQAALDRHGILDVRL